MCYATLYRWQDSTGGRLEAVWQYARRQVLRLLAQAILHAGQVRKSSFGAKAIRGHIPGPSTLFECD